MWSPRMGYECFFAKQSCEALVAFSTLLGLINIEDMLLLEFTSPIRMPVGCDGVQPPYIRVRMRATLLVFH